MARWSPHVRWLAGAALSALCLGLAGGCATAPASARPSEAVAPLAGRQRAVYQATPETMTRMIARATASLHWAVASIRDEVTASAIVIWTPADQEVLVRVRQVDLERSSMQVRVGPFGHAEDEARFRAAVARELAAWRIEGGGD